jgi:hypothetical protein
MDEWKQANKNIKHGARSNKVMQRWFQSGWNPSIKQLWTCLLSRSNVYPILNLR